MDAAQKIDAQRCCRGQKISEHVVIGAHGKLKNWMSKRQLDVSAIKILVFDEADQMLEVGAALRVAPFQLGGIDKPFTCCHENGCASAFTI